MGREVWTCKLRFPISHIRCASLTVWAVLLRYLCPYIPFDSSCKIDRSPSAYTTEVQELYRWLQDEPRGENLNVQDTSVIVHTDMSDAIACLSKFTGIGLYFG